MTTPDINQYVSAEEMLPFGELLRDIQGTDKAVHVGYHSDDKPGRDHHWIAHMPEWERGSEEFISVRISTHVAQVSHVDVESASEHLQPPRVYEWELSVKDVVEIKRTPIPYKKETTHTVECPNCERFGTTHPWKLDDYVPDVCECGYDGDFDIST